MAESESGNFVLYFAFHRKPVQFKKKRTGVVTPGYFERQVLYRGSEFARELSVGSPSVRELQQSSQHRMKEEMS